MICKRLSFGMGFFMGALALLCPTLSYSQWEDVSTEFLVDASCTGSFLGCGVSCVDFNGDGLDDLTIGQASGNVSLYVRTEDGFELDMELLGELQVTGIAWLDVEGDGDLDLFFARRDGGVKLFIRTASGALLDQSLSRGIPDWEGWRPRGISACDFDRDDDLDVYIASYHISSQDFHYSNVLLINDGQGNFTVADDSVGVDNGVQTSFQGGWLDYDGDGWDDLWVINDRFSFPNSLYRNQGDGTFVDMAPELGLDITLDPMTATIFDPDGDGDWDLFSTDVPNIAHQFFVNTDSGFVDLAQDAGLDDIDDYGWGACALDVDGDMREDLMISTLFWPFEQTPADNRLYMGSDSGLYFIEDTVGWPNEQFGLYHLGRFDLNGDRAPDIVGHGTIPIAQLLLNTNEEGASRMTVKLVGTTANSHAVGAVIQVHAGGTQQMQQVDVGSDYVTQHSYTRFFGMGDLETADSVVVTWPGGVVETWYGLEADAAHVLIQGTAGLEPIALERLCPWDSQGWLLPFDADSVDMYWNGVPLSSDVVWVETTGTDVLEAHWWNGAYVLEWSLSSSVDTLPVLAFECDVPVCHYDSVTVAWSSMGADAVYWMDSIPAPPDTVFSVIQDSLHVSWLFGAACLLDTLVEVPWPDSLLMDLIVELPACHDDLATVETSVMGGTPPLNVDWLGASPESLGNGNWPVSLVDAAGCVVLDSVWVEIPDTLEASATWSYLGNSDSVWVDIDIVGGTPPYTLSWNDGWNGEGPLLAPLTLSWSVLDANGCLLLDILSIGVNGMEGGTMPQPQCWRANGQLGFTGAVPAGTLTMYDLTGRMIYASEWISGQSIPCPYPHPVVVRLEYESGQHSVFIR